MAEQISTPKLLTPREAAKSLKVSQRTIYNWIKQGKLNVMRLPGGEFRIPQEEINNILIPERKNPRC